ncbi:hypothetical protein E2562_027168 [Oryza meyeriana var. granulata]|uniref:Uncharacterized protein n=1 Tax=Oryza meyeriana var. granulata TaxID=110450 RepID=A0A6G1EQ06_9ORYZ|nr:hypothetical protein E2562_027168 [Oryza meyeriana var. granulata]
MSTSAAVRKKKGSTPSALDAAATAAPTHTLGRGGFSASRAVFLGRGGGSAPTALSLGRGGGSSPTARFLGRGGGSAAAATRPTTGGLGKGAAMAPSSIDGSSVGAFPSSSSSMDAFSFPPFTISSLVGCGWRDKDPRPPGGFMSYFAHKFYVEDNKDAKLGPFVGIEEETNANRMKILELQQKLSSEKLETTKLAHLSAQETKEGKKLEKESKMMEDMLVPMEPHDEEDEVQDAEDSDPTEVFTMEDMLAEDEILQDMVAEEFKANIHEEASTVSRRRRRQSGPRRYIPRN